MEKNTKKTKEVERKIKIQKSKTIKMRPEKIRCEKCGELCLTKAELKTHVKTHHPKSFVMNAPMCKKKSCENKLCLFIQLILYNEFKCYWLNTRF